MRPLELKLHNLIVLDVSYIVPDKYVTLIIIIYLALLFKLPLKVYLEELVVLEIFELKACQIPGYKGFP